MAVVEQPIGREAAVDRAEAGRFLRFTACAADARGRVDDQALRIDESAVHQGFQREDRGGGVASGGGYRFRATDRRAVELGNAVDELAKQGGGLVRVAVPALVGRRVVEPEVRAEIHEWDAAIEDGGRNVLAVPVGQSGEDQIDVRQRRLVELLERSCIK